MDIPNIDEEGAIQNREMFARFGLAVYHLQCVERSLAIWITLRRARGRRISSNQIGYEFDEEFQYTLGQLMKSMESVAGDLPTDIQCRLQSALQQRNRLVHNYWWEKGASPLTERGRLEAIEELTGINKFFDELDSALVSQYEILAQEHGVDPQTVQNQLLKMCDLPPQTEEKPRLLRRREIMSSAHRARFEADPKKYIPIFALADGTLWTLGDRGLVPAPTDTRFSERMEFAELIGMLPAEFNPKPKTNTNWDYSLDLSNGIRITVAPGNARIGVPYRFRIRRSGQP